MRFPRVFLFAYFCLAAAAPRAQNSPNEYATFMSHGRAVSCAVYGNDDAAPTLIFLRGVSPSELILGHQEAHFFAEHGFRVLLPDYLSTTATAASTVSTATTAANYRRWAQVVDDIVVDLR